MKFRILGPLEVVEDGEPVALGTLKERLVLGVLLLHANEFVSRERLIDDLWGEAPPPTARQAVNVYLSKLRKALSRAGADPIATASGGYQLLVDTERLDAGRMQRLVASARKHVSRGELESAAAHFEEALSLWRGPTLAGLPLESRGRDEVARLDELQLAVLMDRIDCDVALGRHEQALGELGVLVREHPLRERLRAQQMLALYRAGRQADALEAYAEARRTFVGDLGIEPSQPLQRLQQAILRHDPSLETPEGTAAQSTRGVFVGRQRELAQLAACLSEAFDGQGRLILLAGEPGIGKSRLADELSTQARARGARVLVGRCWEAGGAPAYWPWVQSLRAYIREAESGVLRQQLGRGACDLVPLLPELRELYPDLTEPPAFEPESARFRLFDAVSSFVRAAAHARPLVLFLDDLHAADEPSLLLLRFVARELGDSRVLVLGAYRDVDPTIRDPLSATLAELSREPVTRRIELGGLMESEVAKYISRTASLDPEHAVVTAIHAETDGNPLFVAEVTSLLLGEGALTADVAPARIRIPQGVRDVISRRLRRLTEDVQHVLEIASVLGREFPLDALVRLSEFSEGALLDALDEAIAEAIVADVPDAPGRLRFTHVLIRDTLYQELTLARRVRLHKGAGEALETAYAAGIEPHLAELAHHFAEAAATGDVDKAISYARRAGDRAAALLAFEEAVRLFRLGLSLTEADDPARRLQRCELLVVLGDVQARTGDTPAARESFLVAADLAAEIGAAEPLAHSALGYGGRFMWTRSEDDRVVPLLEQAAQALGKQESSLRVMVLARLAGALRALAPERSSALSEEALEVARRLREPGTLAHAISGRLWSTVAPVELDERWALATELVQAKDKERMYEGHGYRMIVLLARADIPGFRRELAQLAEIADALGQPSQRWWVAAQRANLALLEGRLGDAEKLIETARTLGERAESYDALNFFELQRFALRSEQGRLADVLPDLEQSVARDPNRPLLRSALALTYWEVGQEEPARRLLDELAAKKFGQLQVNNDWLFAASLLAKLAASAGEAVKADDLYSRLAPFDGLNVDNTEVSTGAVSHYLALLSAATGHFERAESHFEDALALNQRMGARPWLAHTQREYGGMLAERGKTERAHELVTAALATYRELGMERYATKTTTLARKFSSVTLRQ